MGKVWTRRWTARVSLYVAVVIGVSVVAFLIAEPIYERKHNTDMDSLGGLNAAFPALCVCLLLVLLYEVVTQIRRHSSKRKRGDRRSM